MTDSLRLWSRSAVVRLEAIGFATLSLGAAAIHFAVISAHFAEYVLFGAFFALIGWFQALWAVAYAIRPTRSIAMVAIVVNALTVGLWIWAHVLGLPFGPEPGRVEPTTVTDLMATLFEVLLVAGLIATGRTGTDRQTSDGASGHADDSRRLLAVLGLIAAVAVGTTVALAQGQM